MEIYNRQLLILKGFINSESYTNAINRCIEYFIYLSKYLNPHNETLLVAFFFFFRMLIPTVIYRANFVPHSLLTHLLCILKNLFIIF